MAGDGFIGSIGLEVVRADEGDEAEAAIEAGDAHLNRHGTVHGGVIATLVDSAMGAAVATEDVSPVTIDLTVTYLEPAEPGRLVARARVRRRGSRITIVEAEVTSGDQAVASAMATFTTVG